MASRYSRQAVREERTWRRLCASAEFFAEGFWHIRHPSRGKIRFGLRDSQREALAEWSKGGNWLTLKARQIGWSTLVGLYAIWVAITRPDSQIILLSRTERESIKLLSKCQYGYKFLPEWIRDRVKLTNAHQQKMVFSNGSIIESLPSASDPARGESATLVVVDEWGFLPNGEEAWASIEPVADIGGQIIGLSTANGMGNFFHQMWVKAVTGKISFKTMFYGWWAVPERDDHWYEAKKEELPEWQLHQEYPSDADEAFIKSGRPVFNIERLDERALADESFHGYISDAGNLFRDSHGELSLWKYERPPMGGVYAMGADVAAGLGHGDYSSAHVLEVATGDVVAHWHGHCDPDEFAERLDAIGRYYNSADLCVEANNHGLTTIYRLRQLRYPKLFKRRIRDQATTKLKTEYGFLTTASTKPELINGLGAAIRDRNIYVPDEDTRQELRTYVRDSRGRTNGSPFDDRVISLALAEYVRTFLHQPNDSVPQDLQFTGQWWKDQLKKEPEGDNRMGQIGVRS